MKNLSYLLLLFIAIPGFILLVYISATMMANTSSCPLLPLHRPPTNNPNTFYHATANFKPKKPPLLPEFIVKK